MEEGRKKIVFLTYHNWDAKRMGGFHKFAEYACLLKYKTIFFSFPRPIWGMLGHSDVYNYRTINKIRHGIIYNVCGNKLLNITCLSFSLPIPSRYLQYFPAWLLNFFEKRTYPSFDKFAKKYFENTDFFVFESTSSILLLRKIKTLFPNSKIIYRPSDPLIAFPHGQRLKKQEISMMKTADIVFIVNELGLNIYKKNIPDIGNINYKILSNGVDIAAYKKAYTTPELLKKGNTALYMGAVAIDWDFIVEAAEKATDINFIIVCPTTNVPNFFLEKVKTLKNLDFVTGVNREDVPAWVTNAGVIIVPYQSNLYKKYPWGMTAKYYQAMVAHKPIISHNDSSEFRKYGVMVANNCNEFIDFIRQSMGTIKHYEVEIPDWNKICEFFYEKINNLK